MEEKVKELRECLEGYMNKQWNRDKQIVPMAVFDTKGGYEGIPLEKLMNKSGKELIPHILEVVAEKNDSQICGMISESYFYSHPIPSGEDGKKITRDLLNKYGKVSSIPGRKDSVQIMIWTKQKSYMIAYEVTEDKSLKLIMESEEDIENSGDMIFSNPFKES